MTDIDIDARVMAHAERQHGTFARRQAREAGASSRYIDRRIVAGDWLRESGPGLALAGHDPACHLRTVWLALHHAGPAAVASHWTAIALHGIEGFPRARVHVTVPHGRGNRRNPFAERVHQTVAPAEPVVVEGVPVTPLARTLVDMAKLLGPRRLGAAVDDAIASRRLTVPALGAVHLSLARSGRSGVRTMALVLAERGEHGYIPPQSELERLLDEVLDSIPGPRALRQVDLAGRGEVPHRVDRLFRDPPLIVEADGRRWHMRVRDHRRDRERDRHALLLGYPTVRYGWEELVHHRRAVRAELMALLGRA